MTPEDSTIEGRPVAAAVASDLGLNAPKPKVHDLQARYAEAVAEPFVFRWADREWTLPHMRSLDYRIQGEIEALGDIGLAEISTLFARIFGPEQAEQWAQVEVPSDFILMLFDEWVTHSGAKPGELPASTPSSETTGTTSRPTSAPSTDSASPKRSTAKRAPRKAASPRGKSST